MTFVKLVAHAAAAGLYGGVVVALLVTLLNPARLAAAASPLPALLTVVLAYTIAAACVWPCLYGGLRYFASHRLRLPVFSLRYVMAFYVANLSLILASGWTTLSRSRGALEPAAMARAGTALWILTLAWAAAAIVTLVPRLTRVGSFQGGAAVLAIAALPGACLAGLAAPGKTVRHAVDLAAPAGAPQRRVVVLNFDGADLDFILPLEAQGKLPAFSRLRREGAYGRLRSGVPCIAGAARATLITGKLPYRHGVRSATSRRLPGPGPWVDIIPAGLGFDLLLGPLQERRPQTIEDRTALALWEIAARAGGTGIDAGWDVDLDQATDVAAPSGSPPWLDEWFEPESRRRAGVAASAAVAELVAAVRADDRVRAALEAAGGAPAPGVVAASFPGLDRVAHAFYRYARPREFGNVPGKDVELYGDVLERYYRKVDGIVGRVVDAAGRDGALVMITSAHGMTAIPLSERLWARGRGPRSGTHEGAPDGVLFARGPGIAAGRMIGKGALADVVPTCLYALGLPIARDLDGSILAGVFLASYTFEHPVAVIDTYEPPRQSGGR